MTKIGLLGKVASGKDTLAEVLELRYGLLRLSYAAPLYEISSIIRDTEGKNAQDRVRYMVHEILSEVFGPPTYNDCVTYDELCALVLWCSTEMVPQEGRARSFIQELGDKIRDRKPSAIIDFLNLRARLLTSPPVLGEHGNNKGFVITDMRLPAEAEDLKEQDGIIIRMGCDESVRMGRLIDRGDSDIRFLDSHYETSVDVFPQELIDLELDSTEMSPIELAEIVAQKYGLTRTKAETIDKGDAE